MVSGNLKEIANADIYMRVFYECSMAVHPLGGILHHPLMGFPYELFMELLYLDLGFGYRG